MLKSIIRAKFPELTEDTLVEAIANQGTYREVDAGESIMSPGQQILSVPLLITGTIKVMGQDEDGRELLLYHLFPGDTCAMSLTCCMANKRSEISAIAEDDLEMIEIPVYLVDEWMNKFKSWKGFVMSTYQKRFDELLKFINQVAFKKMDQRLVAYLKEKSDALNSDTIHATHREIANELGTSREVVSRLLKQLELSDLIELQRNEIKLTGM
jgi:CRP/FNR family transcriptional regulator